MKATTFFWFRRDLRLEDNLGLQAALAKGTPVQCLFIFDANIIDKLEDRADPRITFIHRQLIRLNEELKAYGSRLLVKAGNPEEVWRSLIEKYDIAQVVTNKDYEPYAKKRDSEIASLLRENGINFEAYKDQVIFDDSEVVKPNGQPYTVFTPYKKRWLSHYETHPIIEANALDTTSMHFFKTTWEPIMELSEINFKESSLNFPSAIPNDDIIKKYHTTRDIPSINGTSRMSVHLRFGTISIRKCLSIALKTNDTWLSELIWREFYMMILHHFPHVADGPFRRQYAEIPWANNETHFKAWCEGKTGYPMVDAGMRELNETGFMHNRARMVTASFLTKHLLIDWRWGEAYFAAKLLDFDLSANNGGWQWAAGTGCDAAPYFRVFNPTAQAQKFDPEFKYIKKWIPEFQEFGYPQPIVDHAWARERAISTYKTALSTKN